VKLATRFASVFCLLLIGLLPSSVQVTESAVPGQSAQHQEGALQFAELGEFKLQSGAVIHDFRLGYRTLGKLNAEKSNAILWPSWLGGKSEDAVSYIGPGKVVDTGKYFVILVDAIGNGVSTSPSNSASQKWKNFPEFTIRDMVESQRRLATEVLHLSHLYAVMGISMGGKQTFEWILAYPDFMDLAIPMVGSPQATSYDKLQWTAEIDAIESDPAWNNGDPKGPLTRGFALAEEISALHITSPAYRATHTTPGGFDKFLADLRKSAGGDGGAAWDQIRQRQAIMSMDAAAEFGGTLEEVAKRVLAKLLVIVSPQDHVVNPLPALKFAAAIGAPVITLDSPCGHVSLACISAGPLVNQFLSDPASVRSQTLRDPANP
jgi:homoserine O-acetyltransferase